MKLDLTPACVKPEANGRFRIHADKIEGVLVKTYERSTSETLKMKELNASFRGGKDAKGLG